MKTPLPHHRTCGSASGGSVRYDEDYIALGSSLSRLVASTYCSMPDVPAVSWTSATFLNFLLQLELPNIQTRLSLSDSCIGFAAFSTVSTPSASFAFVTKRRVLSYASWHPPMHNNSPSLVYFGSTCRGLRPLTVLDCVVSVSSLCA